MDSPASITHGAAAFENDPIDVDGLPRLHEQRFEPLDPAYARVRAVAAAVAATIVVSLATVAAVVMSTWFPLAIGAVGLVIVMVVAIAQRIETDHMAYLVREHDVSFRSGFVGRTVATVPFARVQHVSIDRGPIDRRFGLAALQLRTAGGHISVPGLRSDVAEQLKELVADRAGALANAEVEPPFDTEAEPTVEPAIEPTVEPTVDAADDAGSGASLRPPA